MKRRTAPLFNKVVWEATRLIPKGRVATYGLIAKIIGRPKAARAVGNALNKNPYAPAVPCHRVVRSDGTVGGFAGGTKQKIILLTKEGIAIKQGRVQFLEKYLYKKFS